jgi:hypothetical protein
VLGGTIARARESLHRESVHSVAVHSVMSRA